MIFAKSHPCLRGSIFFTVMSFWLLGFLAVDATAASQSPSELGKKSLQSRRYPWYDAENDSLHRPTLPTKVAPESARDWT